MTRSKRLMAEAYDEFTATAMELAELDEALSGMDLTGIRSSTQAKEFLQGLLEDQADERAMEKAAPKWRRVYYTMGAGEVCNAPGCLELAGWEIETIVENWIFVVRACDRHAGKEI